ncbi:hypothetical protein A3733_12015 [Pseudoalteromonas shioyasakiensis]|nr:hypothetical protein A3733_12015 [Pseudoalteromonas shioyasakiensis]
MLVFLLVSLLADSPNHIKARSECYGLFAFWGGENPLRAYKTAAYWLTHQIKESLAAMRGFLLSTWTQN